MTRELKYLDKTGMEPKGLDLVVLRNRGSPIQSAVHVFVTFFSMGIPKNCGCF